MTDRPLRIAINTLTTTARKAGVGEYIAGLIEVLPRLAPDWEFVVFTARDNRHFFKLNQPNVREVQVGLAHDPFWIMRPLYLLWQQFVLPRQLKAMQVDVIHHPNTMMVRKGAVPTVITIHDLAEYHLPDKYSALRSLFRKRAVRTSVQTCALTIAVSEHARQDLITLAKADPNRVITTHEGFSPRFSRPSDAVLRDLRKRHKLSNCPFVLFVGTLQASKNVETLVHAVHRARQTLPDLRLVLVGKDGNGVEAIEKALDKTQGREWTLRMGYQSDEEVPAWYAAADAVAYPSLFEGFGLPVLEAQGVGSPLVCSNVASLPEVAGDGAILLPPLDVDAWAKALVSVIEDGTLRGRLLSKGKRNLERFQPAVIGQRVLDVYRKAARA